MPPPSPFRLRALATGLALALPAGVSDAQEPKVPKVGTIILGGPGLSTDILKQGFARLGHVEGRTIAIEFRYAQGQLDRTPGLAAELVNLDVDVIVAAGAVAIEAARKATSRIPIVFAAVLDPLALGYAASLERPGGNVTGVTSFDPEQATRQLGMLKEIVPSLSRIALLSDRNVPRAEDGWNPLEKSYDTAARALKLVPQWIRVSGPAPDLAAAFAAMRAEGAEALLALEMPVILRSLEPIAELAATHRIPTMSPAGWGSTALVSYGTSILDATRRIPDYVDRILKGANPADLPIEVVTRRRLVVNLKMARDVGVTIPPGILERADQVIQ